MLHKQAYRVTRTMRQRTPLSRQKLAKSAANSALRRRPHCVFVAALSDRPPLAVELGVRGDRQREGAR